MQLLKRLALSGLTALWLVHGALIAEEQQDPEPNSEAEQPPEPQAEPTASQESDQQSITPVADEQAASEDPQEVPAQSLFPPDQIEQLVAPVALYPDALLAQTLMAATYPTDIVQAARWMRDNEKLEGEALEKAADEQPWDPSVKTLVFFPGVLDYMNENLAWTQDLGDAMVAQQDEIMDAVQKLRNQAQDAGTLETNEQQRVESEGDTIVVQPADPEVVYVPTYDPSTVYGQTAPPATTYYPATYTTPVTTTSSSTTDRWITFGAGALVGGLLTAAILWDRNDYGIYRGGRGYYGRPGYWGNKNYWKGGWKRSTNINRNVDRSRGDINVNRGDVNINREVNKWQPSRTNVGRNRPAGAANRPGAGNRPGDGNRPGAGNRPGDGNRPGAGNRPGDGNRPGGGPGQGPRPAQRPAAKPAQRPATREAARPASPAPKPGAKPAQRPAAKPAKKPAAKPAQRPAAKPARKPAAKPAQRPAAKPAKRPAAQKPAKRPAKASSGKSSGFKVNKGNATRAASNRGAKSRGGARSAKRGGGGGHARRGGGGRRR